MIKPAVLVIDIGTSLIKSSLFDFTCRSIDRISCAHDSGNLNIAAAAERWWTIVAGSTATLASRNPEWKISAVGLTGFMHSVVPLDKDGTPIPVAHCASSRQWLTDEMLDHFSTEWIYERTGSRLDVTSAPLQILAWRELDPDAHSRIARILPVKDFLRYRLTGEILTDAIDACGTMLYDIRRRQWDSDLSSYCGLKQESLPPVLECTERAGCVTPKAASVLGLPENIPVAVGGGDDIEILGCGVKRPGEICEHVGSTGSFLMPRKTAEPDPGLRLELYPAIAHDEWVLGGSCSNVTRTLDWFLSSSSYSCDGSIRWTRVRADLTDSLARIDADRPLFIPYIYGERAPLWDSALTGAWKGLRHHHTAADLLLAVVEGICFSMRSILDVYQELGLDVHSIHSSGGFNQLPVTRMRASVYAKSIRCLRGADPTSFAAAAITLCSIGELDQPKDAMEWLDFEPEVEPEPDWHAVLDDRFQRFSEYARQLSVESKRPVPQ